MMNSIKTHFYLQRFVIFVSVFLMIVHCNAHADDAEVKPTVERGATVFEERCSLCHGQHGLGEGLLALKIEEYPNTNLMSDVKARSREDVHEVITMGPQRAGISKYMPPMGNDLTWTELESVVDFVLLLRSNPEKARKLANASIAESSISIREGMSIFDTRCALCHGSGGEGNGRMAKIIKTPPPFDLTASRMPDAYLAKIIEAGGEGVGRSQQMPPWGDQLTENQIRSVISYLKTLRD